MTLEQLREQRRELAFAPRGILANNDGCDCLYYPKDLEITVENFLDRRTTALADEASQVGAIAYCTISSGFSFFTHDTEAGTVLTREPADYGIRPDRRNAAQPLIDLGSDCLQSVVDFGHAHDMDVFWSMRMNDTHDNAHSPDNPYLLFPPLKEEHPEWLVGNHEDRTPHGRWSSVNYALPEIRDRAFSYVEEVCRNYDVDGIEMDFFRHPMFFKGPAWGKDATQAELGALTAMVRRVRGVTEREGLRRGRPILVATRVPDSADYCKAMGIDLERWLAEGLIDLMAVSGYFRLNRWQMSVELGHRHGVPVYPCLSETRVRDSRARKLRASLTCYRARAMNVWASGADGVYLFNFFKPRSPLWRQLGDPETLARMDKVYTTGARDPRAVNRWMRDGESRFLNRRILCPGRPIKLQPGQAAAVELRVGEDIPQGAAVTAQLRVKGLEDPDKLTVELNGTPLSGGRNGIWIDYAVKPSVVRKGVNRFAVTLAADAGAEPVVQDLALWVRHRKGK
ncbi:MAG: family 10 glycosylhydrolase [Planctomycetota bacterium]